MAEDILQIDYSQIDLIAAHFNTQAETVDQLLANLNQQVSSVRDGGWLGEAAEAFFSEYQDLVEPGIVRLSEALSEGNRITLQMSALLQNAEEEAAAQIAFEGSSGIGDTFNQAQLVLANGYETAMEMVEEFGQNRVVDAFRAGYSHQIPRDMVDHYAYGNGAPLHFNEDQMAQLAVDADISQSDEFQKVINEIAAKGGGTQKIGLTVLSEADTDGTLGNFHIDFSGEVTVDVDDQGDIIDWSFEGDMRFRDVYDFDPKPPGVRSDYAEKLTRLGKEYLPGQPYEVTTDAVPVSQNSRNSEAQWKGADVEEVNSRLSNVLRPIAGEKSTASQL